MSVDSRRLSATIRSHDLFIAATAAATRRQIITTDRSARFGNLPGVECIHLS